MHKKILVTVCFVGITVMAASFLEKPYYDIQDVESLFKDFVKEYKKQYNGKEYLEKFEIFKATIRKINERNAMFPETVFEINHFADMTKEELEKYRGFKPLNSTRVITVPDSPVAAPDQLDWREKGVVSHVKNQENCGSCFIFSAIGNIEGQYALKHNECIALSEQQALDCLEVGSCNGGLSGEVMQQFANKSGVMKEADYPYVGAKGKCKKVADKVVAVVKAGSQIHIPDEDVLKQKLADIGPLAVSLNADDFPFYNKGILKPKECTGKEHDHAVVLVGYGEENGTKFWIIKNSWGLQWGESGYVRLLRGVNACSMGTSYTASATVA